MYKKFKIMAELLIRLETKNNENGYVVTIQENGWHWGSAETLPTFGILKIPDATVEQIKYLAELVQTVVDGNITNIKRRYNINSATINKFAQQGGVITVTWTQAQKFINGVIA
jgi:hypothetical protein